MPSLTRILIVDDDRLHGENVAEYCEFCGWTADTALCADEADRKLFLRPYDLMLLDITMPMKDGVTYCRELRQRGITMPIIMLTADDDTASKINGLRTGADDYITKPFDLEELGARIEAVLRRTKENILQVSDLVFDTARLTVSRGGRPLSLSGGRRRILKELMLRSPGIVTRPQLEAALWGGKLPESDALRSSMYQLRQAVDKNFEKKLIRTHQGVGWSIGDGDEL